jgi:threonine dehydratase
MVTLADVQSAQERITGHIIRTPVIYSPTLSTMTGAEVYLKLETLQKAGSFKVRGATNKILIHRDEILASGVVAASAGNHAQGVVVAAHSAGIPATVVMPEWASLSKQEATRGYGARVIIHGASLEESIARAMEISRDGALFIHPFDDDEIIAGQGTVGLEILADLPKTDTIVVPVGGGGLIAGIAVAAKALRPSVKIVGVQTSSCPSALESIRSSGAVCIPARETIADGIRVEGPGSRTFPAIRDLVDHIALTSEDEIADAMLLLLERKHVVAEGAGAVPVAALMNGSIEIVPGSTIVLVISGGNIDSHRLFTIVRQSLVRQGRIVRFSVLLEDEPGALARLLGIIAEKRGNILHISHSQGEPDMPVHIARVELELETRGRDHYAVIRQSLVDAGYNIRG